MIDITEVEVGDYLVSTRNPGSESPLMPLAFPVCGFRSVTPGNYLKGGKFSWPVDNEGNARNPRFLRKYTGAFSVFTVEIGSEI